MSHNDGVTKQPETTIVFAHSHPAGIRIDRRREMRCEKHFHRGEGNHFQLYLVS